MLRWANGAKLVAMLTALAVLVTGVALAAGGKVKNGNFEQGSFKHWKRANTGDGKVYLYDRGLYDDPSGAPDDLRFALEDLPVPPPRGEYSAIIAQGGPGNRLLYRKLKLPKRAKSLSLRTFWANQANEWRWTGDFNPSLDDNNEFFSIDLLKPKADPLSGDGPKVLKTVFRPKQSTPFESGGWQKASVKVGKLAGKKVQLRLAEVDNLAELVVGLDDVKIKTKKRGKKG